jgi:hypothetical protein
MYLILLQFNELAMNLQARINLMCSVGDWLKSDPDEWQQTKQQAFHENGWFTPEFIDKAVENIYTQFLDIDSLNKWVSFYKIDDNISSKNVGIVMAGNIPLVGFHDFLAVFICGHQQTIKLSGKDSVLLKHLVKKMTEMNPQTTQYISFSEQLKGCDAYIATGSNNSARYFEQYFSKYPHIIRRNRTSVAIITGQETDEELSALSDDIHLYFGMGCRNVSKLFLPRDLDFVRLLNSFDKYQHLADHHKYKNNYDYQLSIILLNNIYYMTNGTTLLTENTGLFSPISQVFYEFYDTIETLEDRLENNTDIQCVEGPGYLPFGQSQAPGLFQYADGIDTMSFLLTL